MKLKKYRPMFRSKPPEPQKFRPDRMYIVGRWVLPGSFLGSVFTGKSEGHKD